MEKCFKLNAANNFFDILSGSEFVAFLGYGNKVEAFAKNRVIVKKSSPKNLSADCRSTVGRQLTDRLPTVYRQLTNRLPTG